MKIDQTRYEAFWENPERYRIQYELNLVPQKLAYGLQRGIAFHVIANQVASGASDTQIADVLYGRAPDTDGRLLSGITQQAIDNAVMLWNAFESTYGKPEVLLSECEFDVTTPFGHSMIGRIDRIAMWEGRKWVMEFKSGSARTRRSRVEDEWRTKKQADFEIIGAASLGHEVEGVLVFYVLEPDVEKGKLQPQVWEPLQVRRSPAALARTAMEVDNTCNLIEFLQHEPGINSPWPHRSNFPCSGDCHWCGYEAICGASINTQELLASGDWKLREEHLALLRPEEVKAA